MFRQKPASTQHKCGTVLGPIHKTGTQLSVLRTEFVQDVHAKETPPSGTPRGIIYVQPAGLASFGK